MPTIATLNPINEHRTRQSFVGAKVNESDLTKRIIDAIMPFFPAKFKVIGGYLTDEQAIWKVNWHWEALLHVIDAALKLELSDRHAKCVNAIRAVLLSNPPKPQRGYLIVDANA